MMQAPGVPVTAACSGCPGTVTFTLELEVDLRHPPRGLSFSLIELRLGVKLEVSLPVAACTGRLR